MCVVSDAVKDGIGLGRIADHFVPGRDGKLTGDNLGEAAVGPYRPISRA